MYYDAHMHLNDAQLIDQRQAHVDAFLSIGGAGMIIVGTDYASNEQAINLVQNINKQYGDQLFCKATVGIHPSEVAFGNITTEQGVLQAIEKLNEQYQKNKEHIVAFGECGLDAHYPNYTGNVGLQKTLFTAQVKLAQTYDMPLVVHSRDDFVGTYELMCETPDLKRYLHCRSYTPHELTQLAAHFPHLRVGRCCNMTYPKAQVLRESLIACQTTNIQWLLETDAPYLSPQGKRGEINTSANISTLYFAVSELLDLPLIEVQKIVAKNFMELYKTPRSFGPPSF